MEKQVSEKTKNAVKYIFVVGGVMSGVGKGITTSSLAHILQSRGYTVTAIKIDPYINVDAGTMNPTEHGEVFVLEDGYETDQDMGNYERFLNTSLSSSNYMTTGSVYQTVIARERNLEYEGKCVQVVPHIPLEVIARIKKAGTKAHADIVIIEIGGTVGEYENILFLEAVRMLKIKHPNDVVTVMVSYVPIPSKVGEAKTKPTQHAVRTLQGAGIQPDFIIARSEKSLDARRKEKISLFCNVREEHVISAPDIDSIYEVPLNFERDHLSSLILNTLNLPEKEQDMQQWTAMVHNLKTSSHPIHIGIIGKYFETGDFVLSDAYISVIEAVKHASCKEHVKPVISWINSTHYEKDPNSVKELLQYDGVIVPGGFGSRGIEGKISALQFCREQNIPTLGICYGMQMMVVEYARNIHRFKKAHTTEVDPKTQYPVIDILPEQKKNIDEKNYGGTMRLGSYPAILQEHTLARSLYTHERIIERHRHRYEVNPEYITVLESSGLIFSGTSPDKRLMEIVELPKEKHPYYIGSQFHPELTSRPLRPNPLFIGLVRAAKQHSEKK